MPTPRNLNQHPNITASKKQRQKQPVARKRIFWLITASVFAYLVTHATLLAGLGTQGQDTREHGTLLEMLSVALFPLLLLVGYGARTYKWGLWALAAVLLGLTTLNGWLV